MDRAVAACWVSGIAIAIYLAYLWQSGLHLR